MDKAQFLDFVVQVVRGSIESAAGSTTVADKAVAVMMPTPGMERCVPRLGANAGGSSAST